MNQTSHRLGVSEATLVKRKLKLACCDPARIDAAVEEIDQIFGMDDARFEPRSAMLYLAYDATRTCLDCVEEILLKHNVSVSDSLWMRIKQNFYHFTDDNVKDNASHEPWSCH